MLVRIQNLLNFTAGKWGSGSLPSDVRQDLKIGMLEMDMDKVMSKLYNGVSKDHD